MGRTDPVDRADVRAWRTALALALGLIVWACREPASSATVRAATRCDPDLERPRTVSLGQRGHDVAIASDGTYVLALERRVVSLDPCSLAPIGACEEPRGARALHRPVGAGLAEYTRLDGTFARCTFADGSARSLSPSVPSDATVTSDTTTVVIENGAVILRSPGVLPRRLRVEDEPLSAALDPTGRLALVADRSGALTFFSSPHGLRIERIPAHDRNAYAVAFDPTRARVVSISGPGALDVRPVPPRALAWLQRPLTGASR